MRISDWSSDVCSSDLRRERRAARVLVRASTSDRRGHADPRRAAGLTRRRRSTCPDPATIAEIGRASCRERVCQYVSISVVDVSLKKKTKMIHTSTHTLRTNIHFYPLDDILIYS